MNPTGEASESSGSEFNPCREDYDSSTSFDASVVPANRKSPDMRTKRKKTRADAVPLRSTPKPFSFSDNDDLGTPILRRKKGLTAGNEAELLARLAAVEAKLGKTVDELTRRNTELTRTTVRQQQQITELRSRVAVLERGGSQEKSKTNKVGNGVKQAVRVAVVECSRHKGMELDLDTNMQSTNNRAVAAYCWKYAKTVAQDMTSDEFKVAMDRYLNSKKEQESRTRRGKLQAHTDGQRKNQRKRRKSRSRVEGLELSELPQHVKTKYRQALSQREMMSTEESDVDDDGHRIFRTKQRNWEAPELTSAKRIADAAYTRKSGSAPATKMKRTRGYSDAPVPSVNDDNRWTIATEYGLL